MEFNLRALCAARAYAPLATACKEDILGRRFEFNSGLRLLLDVGECAQECATPSGFAIVLGCLEGWARVYRHKDGDQTYYRVLGLCETSDSEPVIHLVDLVQPPADKQRRVPSPATVIDVLQLSLDEATESLIDLSRRWPSLTSKLVLQQPKLLRPQQTKIAVTGSPVIEGVAVAEHVFAMGRVLGADITFINASSFNDTRQRLADLTGLDGGIVICTRNPYLNEDVLPHYLDDDAIYECHSPSTDLLVELRVAIELLVEQFVSRARETEEEDAVIMRLLLGPMVSHSKIGQYNHCSKDEVLSTAKARKQNLHRAQALLTAHSEKFQSMRETDKLFLWKAHHEGPEYFLNPKAMTVINALLGRQVVPPQQREA